jgi:hypothetical protein
MLVPSPKQGVLQNSEIRIQYFISDFCSLVASKCREQGFFLGMTSCWIDKIAEA